MAPACAPPRDPAHLPEDGDGVGVGEVVEEHRRQRVVEAAVGERQAERVGPDEVERAVQSPLPVRRGRVREGALGFEIGDLR